MISGVGSYPDFNPLFKWPFVSIACIASENTENEVSLAPHILKVLPLILLRPTLILSARNTQNSAFKKDHGMIYRDFGEHVILCRV